MIPNVTSTSSPLKVGSGRFFWLEPLGAARECAGPLPEGKGKQAGAGERPGMEEAAAADLLLISPGGHPGELLGQKDQEDATGLNWFQCLWRSVLPSGGRSCKRGRNSLSKEGKWLVFHLSNQVFPPPGLGQTEKGGLWQGTALMPFLVPELRVCPRNAKLQEPVC